MLILGRDLQSGRHCPSAEVRLRLRHVVRIFVARAPHSIAGLGLLLHDRWVLTCHHVIPATDDLQCATLVDPKPGTLVQTMYLEGSAAEIAAVDWPLAPRCTDHLSESLVLLKLVSPAAGNVRPPLLKRAADSGMTLVGATRRAGLPCAPAVLDGLEFKTYSKYPGVILAQVSGGAGQRPVVGDSGGPIMPGAQLGDVLLAIQNASAPDSNGNSWTLAIPVHRARSWIQQITGITLGEAP